MRLLSSVQTTADIRGLIRDPDTLTSLLNRVAASLQQRVLKHGPVFEIAAPGFDRRFVRPFQAISRIEFLPLSSGAAYEFNETTAVMTVNTGHASGMLEAIVRDVEASPLRLHPDELGVLVRLAIELLLLHEVRHSSQGVGDYADVQKLKTISEMLLGEFDLLADRDAAQAYALLRLVDEGVVDDETYLRFFAEALFFMGQYAFPAFKTPLSKPHKVARALGLTLMLARLILAEREGMTASVHAGRLPLDAALMPEISVSWDSLTIFAYAPDLQLVGIGLQMDRDLLMAICERLDDGAYESVLEDVIRLIRGIQL